MPSIAVLFFIAFLISAFLGTSVPMGGRKIPMPPEHLRPKKKKPKKTHR